ncbi:hypothetical protein FRC06_002622 [Ceratobasidium sp. 370]|nr:hypothetical protein FRC06_002622 [Ceratobasidium sp. 370]
MVSAEAFRAAEAHIEAQDLKDATPKLDQCDSPQTTASIPRHPLPEQSTGAGTSSSTPSNAPAHNATSPNFLTKSATISAGGNLLPGQTATWPTTPIASRKRSHVTSPTSALMSPPAKRVASTPVLLEDLYGAFSPEKLGSALKIHGANTSGPLLVGTARTISIHFFQIPKIGLQDLVDNPQPLDFHDTKKAALGYLVLDVAAPDSTLGTGTFKRCSIGDLYLNRQPESGLGSCGQTMVALKRPFKRDEPNQKKRLAYADEYHFITIEAKSWMVGAALLDLVETYITAHPGRTNKPKPAIPNVRFVDAAVAKCITPNQGSTSFSGGYLVEERIPAEQDFWRFIGNGSAVPVAYPPNERMFKLGQFYSFCQHVQWVLTKGMAYCADWQGGCALTDEQESLLTDPQIMTHP